jgi:tyrosyl-tRNA synthetase
MTRVKSGSEHPMLLKKKLAKQIVTDFHSEQAASIAADDWARQFQSGEVPEEISEVEVMLDEVCGDASFKYGPMAYATEVPLRVEKLLARSHLVSSNSEGGRKIKERAVRIGERLVEEPLINVKIDKPLVVRVGRQVRKIRVRPNVHGDPARP